MVTHSSVLTWEISWTEEPGRLQSMGSQSPTWLSKLNNNKKMRMLIECFPLYTPLPSMRSQSQTRLKRLSSRSSSSAPPRGVVS